MTYKDIDNQTYFAVMELLRAILKIADFYFYLKAGFNPEDASISVSEIDIILNDDDVIDHSQLLIKLKQKNMGYFLHNGPKHQYVEPHFTNNVIAFVKDIYG